MVLLTIVQVSAERVTPKKIADGMGLHVSLYKRTFAAVLYTVYTRALHTYTHMYMLISFV